MIYYEEEDDVDDDDGDVGGENGVKIEYHRV